MSKKECCTTENQGGTSVTVTVDVTKIVKYICFAGICIVGIIFGTKTAPKILSQDCCRFFKK